MRRSILLHLTCLLLLTTALGASDLRVLRSRFLQARPQALRNVQPGEKLPLRLFDDLQLEATLDRVEIDPLNGYVWRGHIEEIPGSWVVLVESDGCLAGTIAGVDSYYRIRCLGQGVHAIDEVELDEPFLDDVELPAWEDASLFEASQDIASTLGDDEIVEMDLMVLYTKKAAKNLVREIDTGISGKRKAMKSQIQLAVAIANTVLENSDVNIRFRLVKIRQVRYQATGESGLDLYYLYDTEDGNLDQIHGWRDKYGADFVSLVLEDTERGVGGRGYQVTPNHSTADEWLFSVIRYDLLWWVALTHELGHNMGLAHDRKNDQTAPGAKSYPYSFGYQDKQGGFRTIMAYKRGCDRCSWMLPHFSNKNIRWEGASTGSPYFQPVCGDGSTTGPRCGRRTGTNKANAARSLNQTRAFWTDIRSCKVSCVD